MKSSLLRAERRQRGWSQAKVAEALGVTTRTVMRWEQGMVIPHPYYREPLCILFGMTAEELGLPSAADENDMLENAQATTPDIPPLAFILAEPAIPKAQESPQSSHEWDTHSPEDLSFPLRSFWGVHIQMGRVSTFGTFNRFSWHSLLIPSTIVLAILIIIAAVPAFTGPPSPSYLDTQDNYSPPSYTLTIENADPSLQETAQHFQNAFNAVYPQLVNRFALDPAITMRDMRLTFASNLPSAASISGMTITIRSDWMRQHPGDVGLLTHELTLVVEAYPSGAPAWFADGMADYARSVYGPADDDEWSLPDSVQPQDSYTQGSGVAGRFLLWLEQHMTLDIVDQLNHALQTKQSFSAVFQRLTHRTEDELWGQYRAHPDIMLTPQQLYKTATSRKPLYQSSLRVQLAIPGTYQPIFAHGLYVSNFAIQADMTIVSGDGGGFIFRNDMKHNANERLRVSPDGTYDLVNQTVMLASDSSSAIKQGLNQTNKLTIIAHKHIIYVYINSQFITKVDDSSTSYGAVGELALDWGNVADVRFEKVQVF